MSHIFCRKRQKRQRRSGILYNLSPDICLQHQHQWLAVISTELLYWCGRMLAPLTPSCVSHQVPGPRLDVGGWLWLRWKGDGRLGWGRKYNFEWRKTRQLKGVKDVWLPLVSDMETFILNWIPGASRMFQHSSKKKSEKRDQGLCCLSSNTAPREVNFVYDIPPTLRSVI